jgi:hypothetical protein
VKDEMVVNVMMCSTVHLVKECGICGEMSDSEEGACVVKMAVMREHWGTFEKVR